MVKYLKDLEDFQQHMELSKTKLVVIDFTASWCPPCKMIAPVFENMAKEHPEAEFVKVDVDEAEDVAAECGIQAMPTFHFLKGGAKVEELQGADQAKLLQLVLKHK